MLPLVDEAEQIAWDQTWRNLLWIPPSRDEPVERAMLRLDDEMAGLIEAADMPADQHAGAHSTKPEPAVSMPGKVLMNWQVQSLVPLLGAPGNLLHVPCACQHIVTDCSCTCFLIRSCLCCAMGQHPMLFGRAVWTYYLAILVGRAAL